MLQFPDALMGLASRAAQVLEWDRAHRFCGVCGTPTEPAANRALAQVSGLRPQRLSEAEPGNDGADLPAGVSCSWRAHPTTRPACSAHWPVSSRPGESLEDCVHREVAEEVGVTVHNLRYYGSQSWPFPHSLMVAYTAEWRGGEVVPQRGRDRGRRLVRHRCAARHPAALFDRRAPDPRHRGHAAPKRGVLSSTSPPERPAPITSHNGDPHGPARH